MRSTGSGTRWKVRQGVASNLGTRACVGLVLPRRCKVVMRVAAGFHFTSAEDGDDMMGWQAADDGEPAGLLRT